MKSIINKDLISNYVGSEPKKLSEIYIWTCPECVKQSDGNKNFNNLRLISENHLFCTENYYHALKIKEDLEKSTNNDSLYLDYCSDKIPQIYHSSNLYIEYLKPHEIRAFADLYYAPKDYYYYSDINNLYEDEKKRNNYVDIILKRLEEATIKPLVIKFKPEYYSGRIIGLIDFIESNNPQTLSTFFLFQHYSNCFGYQDFFPKIKDLAPFIIKSISAEAKAHGYSFIIVDSRQRQQTYYKKEGFKPLLTPIVNIPEWYSMFKDDFSEDYKFFIKNLHQ